MKECDTFNLLCTEVIDGRVIELEFGGTADSLLDGRRDRIVSATSPGKVSASI